MLNTEIMTRASEVCEYIQQIDTTLSYGGRPRIVAAPPEVLSEIGPPSITCNSRGYFKYRKNKQQAIETMQ